MPLRTEKKGRISAEKAAEITAVVATAASGDVMPLKNPWVPAEFCNQWRSRMKTIFSGEPFKGIGPEIKA